jgi:hypothetical protein
MRRRTDWYIDDVQATVYVYQLVDGKVKVEKVDYMKPA